MSSQAENSRMRLKDKVAIVTGAASGIGEYIARTFALAGALVAVTDLDGARAQRVAQDILGNGGRALGLAMDVTDESAVENTVAEVLRTFGPIDILLANAGIQLSRPSRSFRTSTGDGCWPCTSTAPF